MPEYIILVNKGIPTNIEDNYRLVNTFTPKSISGYRPKLKGEVSAIYAKTIRIYKNNFVTL
jgi:hypothetical protein